MRLEKVIRHMPIPVMVVDAPSGRILHANARARAMVERLGRTIPSELQPDWEIFHPDGRPYAMEEWPLVRSITSGEEVVDEEYFNLLADGSRLFVRCSSAPIRDNGEVIGGLLVMEDITQEKRDQEARAYHAILTDNVEDAVVGTDADFRLTVWNRGAERLYGFTPDEVLGHDAREVATFEGDESRLELESELLETDRTRTEITAVRKDGTPVEVELVSVAVRDEEGEVVGYIGIHRDITERRRAEGRLLEARKDERRRIARALHDEALRGLADALVLAIGARTASGASEYAEQLVPVLQRVGEQLRGAIYDLRMGGEEDRPFTDLMEELVEVHRTMAVDTAIELDMRDGVPAGLLGATGIEVLRIVGEALTNARRHADARQVRVRVWGTEADLIPRTGRPR
jgi:PAS domain S-box-containing protein